MKKGIRNRYLSLTKEIRLSELMKLIPDGEIVIIFGDLAGGQGFPEEAALFNGQVLDWWKDYAPVTDMPQMRVVGILARELDDTVGPVTMIVVDI